MSPAQVLSLAEIETGIPGARFAHLVRVPEGVVTSLLRRARATRDGRAGAAEQPGQRRGALAGNGSTRPRSATTRATISSSTHEAFVDALVEAPETWRSGSRPSLTCPTGPPDHPGGLQAVRATTASHRPWTADAAGPSGSGSPTTTPSRWSPLAPANREPVGSYALTPASPLLAQRRSLGQPRR
jgi:hypothetical protein